MLRLARLLSMTLLLGLFAAPAIAQDRHALVVGINAYDNLGSLEKAVNDGRAMAESLERAGFTVDAGFDLERREFVQLLAQFLNRLEPEDEALVFYAGHAVAIENANYLVPSDASALEQSSEALIIAESIGQDFLLEQITATGVRLTVVIMDACRNNPFEGLTTRSLGRDAGLAVTQPPRGVFMMYSADEGQTALDRLSNDDPDPNSVFTRTLLPLIEEPGLDIVDIARRLRGDVQALAAGVQHQQFPVYRDRMQGDGRFVISPAMAMPEMPEPVAEMLPVVPALSPCDQGRADWAALGPAPGAEVLQAFLEVHADCPFLVALARQRLAEFDAAPDADPTPAASGTQWEFAYSLDLPEGETLISVFDGACAPQSYHDCVIWGVTEDATGNERTAAWLRGTDPSGRNSPGEAIALSGDTDILPVEVIPLPHALYSEVGYILRTADDIYAGDVRLYGGDASVVRRIETFPNFDETRGTFGVLDLVAHPQENLVAMALFGRVVLMRWRDDISQDARRDVPGDPELMWICSIQADGAVPWADLSFSDDGKLLAGRHAAWTVVMEMPPAIEADHVREGVRSCESIGMRGSYINYFPFRDMTGDGRHLAVSDFSDASTYMYDVVGIYRPDVMINVEEVRGFGSPVPLDRVETELGGVANLYGHESGVEQAVFSPEGHHLFSLTEQGVLRFWSIPAGDLLATHETVNGARIERAEFTGAGTCLLLDLSSGPSVFFDPATGEVLHEFRQPSTRFAFDPQSTQVVVYSPGERAARVYSPPAHVCAAP